MKSEAYKISEESGKNKSLITIFRGRLKTQDRSRNKYPFPMRKLVTLFKRERFYRKWIDDQVYRIQVPTGKKQFELREISSIFREPDGVWKLKTIDGAVFELYTRTAAGDMRPVKRGIEISDIVIDHTVAASTILKNNRDKLPVLSDENRWEQHLPELKKELELIGNQTQLQLMERAENAKKSNKTNLLNEQPS